MTKTVIIIGTLHLNSTPHRELEEALKSLKPTQLLVEITQKDLRTGSIASFPDEMVFAAQWAQKDNIPVAGFDSLIRVKKEGVRKEDERRVIEKEANLLQRYSWKDMNRERTYKKLESVGKLIIDQQKWDLREKEMLKNITSVIAPTGTVVVLTGVGHLSFFEKVFPDALFPFRKP